MSDSDPGLDAWKQQTSAFDRVRSVAQTLSQPQSAAWIADEAAVAPNTARDHLSRLVEMHVLREVEGEDATLYEPDPLHVRLQTLRDLLDEHNRASLIDLKQSFQEQVEAWQDEYDVATPDQLRELAATTETATETAQIKQTAQEWDLIAYRLSIVEEAIANYAEYTRTDPASA